MDIETQDGAITLALRGVTIETVDSITTAARRYVTAMRCIRESKGRPAPDCIKELFAAEDELFDAVDALPK